MHDLFHAPRLEIRREALPHGAPDIHRRIAGVDPDQAHTAQDKWQDRGIELDTARIAETRNEAMLLHRPRERGKLFAADGIECRCPYASFERTRARLQYVAPQHFRCAD